MANSVSSVSPPRLTASPQTAIIFFDGECLLCNGFVDLILSIDTAAIFALASLQGLTAQNLLPPRSDKAEDWSMYYLENGTLYSQSDAVLAVMARLGGLWSVLSWGRIIPRPIRNRLYRLIARNRYRWFGRRDTCRMPDPQVQARFLA